MDLDRFTRKLGPFPIYVWAVAILGIGWLAYKYVGRNSAATDTAAPAADTTPASTDTVAPNGSEGIGLASNGNVTPTHIIIDNPAPNLTTPTVTTPPSGSSGTPSQIGSNVTPGSLSTAVKLSPHVTGDITGTTGAPQPRAYL